MKVTAADLKRRQRLCARLCNSAFEPTIIFAACTTPFGFDNQRPRQNGQPMIAQSRRRPDHREDHTDSARVTDLIQGSSRRPAVTTSFQPRLAHLVVVLKCVGSAKQQPQQQQSTATAISAA